MIVRIRGCSPVRDVHVAPLVKGCNVPSVKPALSISTARVQLHTKSGVREHDKTRSCMAGPGHLQLSKREWADQMVSSRAVQTESLNCRNGMGFHNSLLAPVPCLKSV